MSSKNWKYIRDQLKFVDLIYKLTNKFPKTEQFGLVNQLRRAALSIASNIAEGAGRYHNNEKRQFYRMSRSSVHECPLNLHIF
ncbi:MAG: four helix bundle protein [Actinomycetota bacterium]|nr:four helix bundle protein [Actinomycetota bacterium]